MSRSLKIAGLTVAVGGAALLILVAALWLKPPDLIRVGANYTAKIVCSNVFLAGRDADDVLRTDVQAPGHPLLRVMRVSVDRARGVVRAGLFGFIGGGLAAARPGMGCTVLPDGRLDLASAVSGAAGSAVIAATTSISRPDVDAASGAAESPAAASRPHINSDPMRAARPNPVRPGVDAAQSDAPSDRRLADTEPAQHESPQPNVLWPDGDAVRTDVSIETLIADDTLTGPGMRAIVVVHDGRIVGERYADGFGPGIPQLGWSMTKSVMAGLIGMLVKDGRLSLTQPLGPALHWPVGDPRAKISIADLLAMSSGLRFNEGYGTVSDVTRMLYLEPDMAAFASAQPLVNPIGTVWSYSSGSAVMLSRIFQDAAGADALSWVRERLFEPLGMTTAVMEADEHGTLVGSSYMYASPRDWARYGLMLADDGLWRGQEILPRGYVSMMAAPVAASGGEYGHGLVWRWATHSDKPGENPDAAFGIPSDTFWMSGHDGQSVAVIPSKHLVIVRLGLTPSREHYQPERLVQALLGAFHETSPRS